MTLEKHSQAPTYYSARDGQSVEHVFITNSVYHFIVTFWKSEAIEPPGLTQHEHPTLHVARETRSTKT